MKNKFNEILAFQIRRFFNVLAKRCLILFEDLQNEHNIHFDKLRQSLPPEYHNIILQADYFDKNKFAYFRKKILDYIGEGFRDAEEEIKKYSIKPKNINEDESDY